MQKIKREINGWLVVTIIYKRCISKEISKAFLEQKRFLKHF
jgi:hypothetical protein